MTEHELHTVVYYVSLNMERSDGSSAEPASTPAPAPAEVAARAAALVQRYPQCFWYWRPDAPVQSLGDVHLVIRQLRAYGDRDAWLAARDLSECLSPRSRKTS
jgi:hypothetical protein